MNSLDPLRYSVSRMAHFFHAIAAALEANVWFEYVPSAANIADLPSRGEFEKLVELIGCILLWCLGNLCHRNIQVLLV